MELRRYQVAALLSDPANVRTHAERDIQTLMAVLKRFGQQKNIVVDANGIVRAGNGILEAARRLQWEELDGYETDLTGSEATAFAIADNRTAELSTWDLEGLSMQLAALQAEGWDLEQLGWNQAEADPLLQADWSQADPDGDEFGPQLGGAIKVTVEQRVVIDQAISRVRAREGSNLGEGRCIELVCADWLNDPNWQEGEPEYVGATHGS